MIQYQNPFMRKTPLAQYLNNFKQMLRTIKSDYDNNKIPRKGLFMNREQLLMKYLHDHFCLGHEKYSDRMCPITKETPITHKEYDYWWKKTQAIQIDLYKAGYY